MSIESLARPEIVAMKPYSSARKEATSEGILLNANESPWPLLQEKLTALTLNRYPDPQPANLVNELAKLYRVDRDGVLVTRGSDEGIDLLTRVFCRAGKDAILHCPPTFGMYRIAAETQGAFVIAVPRQEESDFLTNTRAVLQTVGQDQRIRLVFLTSPNNPTGDAVDPAFLAELLEVTRDRAIVVMDEAYAEFSQQASVTEWIGRYEHLVVLRTLSKAWASAGLRCGVVLAQAPLIDLLRRVIAPYPVPSPITAMALRVLQPDLMAQQQQMLQQLRDNKKILLTLLENRDFVRKIWPGEANFVLVKVDDAPGLLEHCARGGVILRGYRNDPVLQNCIRISVGSEPDLAALKQVLDPWESRQP